MTSISLTLNRLPLLPFQREMVQSNARNRHVWGGYGSAKSTGAAYAFLRHVLENPWTPAYGQNDRPLSFLLGPTHKSLTESSWRILRGLIPDALILKERKSPDWYVELVNGHQIRPRTFASNIEGSSACGLWADEVSKIPSEETWINFRSRVRDPLARSHLVLTSGLPEDGWQRDHFDKPEFASDPDRLNLHVSSRDNPHLPAHVLADLLASVSKANVQKYIEGDWMRPDRIVYHEFSMSPHVAMPFSTGGNLSSVPGNKALPVILGFDLGNQSAVSFYQEVKRRCRRPVTGKPGVFEYYDAPGLHMVDELYAQNVTLEELCRLVKKKGWILHHEQSKACLDPTAKKATDIPIIRRELGIGVLQAHRGAKEETLSFGHDHMNWALRDADDNVRVTFWSGLPRDKHSVINALNHYHYGPNGKPVRDDVLDHHCDVARYPVVNLLKASQRIGKPPAIPEGKR